MKNFLRSLVDACFRKPLKMVLRPLVARLRHSLIMPVIQPVLAANDRLVNEATENHLRTKHLQAVFEETQLRVEVELRTMGETVRVTDRTLLALGLLNSLPPRTAFRLSAYPRNLYVDLRCLQDSNYSRRGIGFHASGVLRHAKRHLGEAVRLIGLIDPALPALPGDYAELADEITADLVAAEGPGLVLHPSPMTHDGSWLAAMFARPDLLHTALFYDAIPLDEPERYLPTPLAHRAYSNNLAWLRLAHAQCPISELAGRRLRELIGCAAEQVAVTGACLRPAFTETDPSVPLVGPFGPNGYFLFVGGGDPRKNVTVVLEAHASLKIDAGLIVAGHYTTDEANRFRTLHTDAGGRSDRLHFAPRPTDAQLAALYRGAIATLVPSQNEGFSLPVVEALSCGCPVIVSDIPAHRELIAAEEAFFPPSDWRALADRMRRFLDDSNTRGDWLDRQRARAASFAEADVAGRVWSHVSKWLPPKDEPSSGPAAKLGPDRPRLAFLTPLPPEKSGVADHSAACLNSLARHADIDVYTNRSDCRRDPGIRNYRTISETPFLDRKYDRVVTVIGNTIEFHSQCVTLAARHGGACISHDSRLLDFYTVLRGTKAFAQQAGQWLKRPVNRGEVDAWLQNPALLPTLCFEEILPKARPFIVHSRTLQRAIETQYGTTPAYVPFAHARRFEEAELTPEAKLQARARLGLADGVLAIVSFGSVNDSKAPLQCLDALQLLRQRGANAELHFVGSDGGVGPRWENWVRERGLDGRAHFANRWIDDGTYRDYAAAGDAAIQLRTNRSGSISAALADCIAAGLPTVANRDLADALDSPDYVLRVSDDLEATEVADRLQDAVEMAGRPGRFRESRLAYLAERNFETYAINLLKALGL